MKITSATARSFCYYETFFPLDYKFLAGRDFRGHLNPYRSMEQLLAEHKLNSRLTLHCVAQHHVHHKSSGVCSRRHKGSHGTDSSHRGKQWRNESKVILSMVVPYGVLWFAPAGWGRTSYESLSKISKHSYVFMSEVNKCASLFLPSFLSCCFGGIMMLTRPGFFLLSASVLCSQSLWLGELLGQRKFCVYPNLITNPLNSQLSGEGSSPTLCSALSCLAPNSILFPLHV